MKNRFYSISFLFALVYFFLTPKVVFGFCNLRFENTSSLVIAKVLEIKEAKNQEDMYNVGREINKFQTIFTIKGKVPNIFEISSKQSDRWNYDQLQLPPLKTGEKYLLMVDNENDRVHLASCYLYGVSQKVLGVLDPRVLFWTLVVYIHPVLLVALFLLLFIFILVTFIRFVLKKIRRKTE